MSFYSCKRNRCFYGEKKECKTNKCGLPENLKSFGYKLNVDISKAHELTPKERVEVIELLTGEKVPENDTLKVVDGLYKYDLKPLIKYPNIMKYVIENWAPGVIKDNLIDIASIASFSLFQELYKLTEREIYRFIDAALFLGRSNLIEEMFNMGLNQYLIKSLLEIYPDYSYDDERVLYVYSIYEPEMFKKYALNAKQVGNEIPIRLIGNQ